ncbi:hypothetical protein ABFU82_26815 [Nocardioides sp. WV_118_6]
MTEGDGDERAIVDLFSRASGTIPDPPATLVDASIGQGVLRSRRRSARQIVAIAASAAVVGSVITLSTVGLGTWGRAGPAPSASTAPAPAGSAVAGFGVPADQMGVTLCDALSGSTGLGALEPVATGTDPQGWLDTRDRLDYPASSIEPWVRESRSGWARCRGGSSEIGAEVLVQRLDPTSERAADPALWSAAGAGLLETGTGRVYLQGGTYGRSPTSGGAATLITDDGWLVSVVVEDVTLVPVDSLALVALNDVWIR